MKQVNQKFNNNNFNYLEFRIKLKSGFNGGSQFLFEEKKWKVC